MKNYRRICKNSLGFGHIPNAELTPIVKNAIDICTTRQSDPNRKLTYQEIEQLCEEMFPLGDEGLTGARLESLKGCLRTYSAKPTKLGIGGARRTRGRRMHKKRRTTRRR